MKTPLFVFVIALSFALMSCSQEQRQQQQEVSAPDTSTEQVVTAPEEPAEPEPVALTDCTMRVGFDVWEPYQYVHLNNEVQGLDIEVVSSVTKSIGCDVEFIQGTWVSLMDDLAAGQVDMLLGASKTQDREAFAHFSQPYRTEEFVLYVRTDEPKFSGYESIGDFVSHGSKIGVVSEYFYGDEISAMLDNDETSDHFVFGMMGELNVARLLDLDIDAFLEDSFVGASLIRRKGLANLIEPHSISIKTGDIYVMFSKESVSEKQVALFDAALTNYKRTDSYASVMQKYGL